MISSFRKLKYFKRVQFTPHFLDAIVIEASLTSGFRHGAVVVVVAWSERKCNDDKHLSCHPVTDCSTAACRHTAAPLQVNAAHECAM